jgi:hypothetical protein
MISLYYLASKLLSYLIVLDNQYITAKLPYLNIERNLFRNKGSITLFK